MDVAGLSTAARIWAERDLTRAFLERLPAGPEMVSLDGSSMIVADELRAAVAVRIGKLTAELQALGSLID